MRTKDFTDQSFCWRGLDDFNVRRWESLYKKYQSENPELVEIFSVDHENGFFTMEDINGFVLSDTLRVRDLEISEKRKITTDVIVLWGKMQSWSVDGQKVFVHRDYCINNIMYDVDRKHIKLIDPDSFCYDYPHMMTPRWHGTFIDTIYNMRNWEFV
jgi:hypothetical protein